MRSTLLTSLFFPFSVSVATAAVVPPRATWCHGSLSGASGIVSSPTAPNPHWSLHCTMYHWGELQKHKRERDCVDVIEAQYKCQKERTLSVQ